MPHRERLEKLLAFVETLPADQIDMTKIAHSDGTPSCLAGWATKVFPDDLVLLRNNFPSFPIIRDRQGKTQDQALEIFFGLDDAEELFAEVIPNHLAVSNLRSFIERERERADRN